MTIYHGFWLGTNSGKKIDLLDPKPEMFTIDDIATALSKLCRFNGQLREWYSVAEHSIHVAELVPNPQKLTALLHDASEAYLCDVPTPLKRLLGDSYKAIEKRISYAIGTAFDIDLVTLPPLIKTADAVMTISERDALQDRPQIWGTEWDGYLRYPNLQRVYTTPDNAKQAFMYAYTKYKHL